MNHTSEERSERAFFLIASRWGAVGLLALSAGCGAPGSETGEAPEKTGTIQNSLRCYDPYEPVDDINCPWQGEYQEVAPAGGTLLSLTSNPAFCFAPGSNYLMIAADSQQRYRTLAMDFEQHFSNAWDIYAQSQGFKFGSRPACSSRGTSGSGVMIAGRVSSTNGNNNKLFASAGNLPLGNNEDPPPNATGTFTVVDNAHTYTSGGNPALASSDTTVVLVTLGVDGFGFQRIFAYTSGIGGASFGARISGPRVPSGTPMTGTPAIDFQTTAQSFHIVIRGSGALYETYFNGSAFTNIGGSGGTIAFSPLPIGGPFDSDPTLAYSSIYDIETLFWRRGTNLWQTSASPSSFPVLGTVAVLQMPGAVDPTTNPPTPQVFGGAPAAVGLAPGSGGPAFIITRFGKTAATTTRLGYTFTSSAPLGL